jgi:hypothetical protein
MPRHSVGTVAQPISGTALAANIASRLVGRLSDRAARDTWLRNELGVRLRSNGVERAAARARGGVSSSVLVDETSLPLALEKAYVNFPGRGQRRSELITALEHLGVVRQLLVTRSRRDVVCVLVYRREERDHVFSAFEQLGEPFLWDEILEENRVIERSTWVALSRRFAASEDLLERSAVLRDPRA